LIFGGIAALIAIIEWAIRKLIKCGSDASREDSSARAEVETPADQQRK
jgi:hypothetical protein